MTPTPASTSPPTRTLASLFFMVSPCAAVTYPGRDEVGTPGRWTVRVAPFPGQARAPECAAARVRRCHLPGEARCVNGAQSRGPNVGPCSPCVAGTAHLKRVCRDLICHSCPMDYIIPVGATPARESTGLYEKQQPP